VLACMKVVGRERACWLLLARIRRRRQGQDSAEQAAQALAWTGTPARPPRSQRRRWRGCSALEAALPRGQRRGLLLPLAPALEGRAAIMTRHRHRHRLWPRLGGAPAPASTRQHTAAAVRCGRWARAGQPRALRWSQGCTSAQSTREASWHRQPEATESGAACPARRSRSNPTTA
jgi:hypothetical protein